MRARARAGALVCAGQQGGKALRWLPIDRMLALTHVVLALASSPLVTRKSRGGVR